MAIVMRVYDSATDALLVEFPLAAGLSLSYGINSSLQFSGELPENWPKRELIVVGSPVEVFIGTRRLLAGILQRLEPTLDYITRFSGVGTMDSLYDEKIFPLAYYDSKPLLGVLVELLIQAGWLLGDISTLESPDQVTTIDLRSESNLLTQLNKLLTGIPEVFYREGETILGYPSIDIGRFMQSSGISALSPGMSPTTPEDSPDVHWITDFNYQEDSSAVVRAVKALGGNVRDNLAENRVINLGDALSGSIALIADPEFPIIEDLAERNWVAINYRDFGRVGGRVLSTVSGTTEVIFIGDTQGAAVEQNVWLLFTFVPFPGMFESFSLWIGSAVGANVLTTPITWILQEISTSDYRTVIADNLATGTFTADLVNSIKKVSITSPYELVAGKLYGLAIGFDFNPSPDLFNIHFKDRTASTSYSFKVQNAGTRPTVAGLWSNLNALSYLEVITSPLDPVSGGVVGETASKYAPQNTGANSTLAEIRAAGAALYVWAKAYLIDRVPGIKNYNLSASAFSNSLPKVGDTLYVDSKAFGQYIDPVTGRIVTTVRDVQGNLRINSIQADIEDDSAQVTYALMTDTGVPKTDIIVSLYDKTENEDPAQGGAAARPWALLLDTLSIVVGPVSPDTMLEDGTLAVTVSISIFAGSYASRPSNVEEVYMAGLPYGTISPGGQLRVEMVQLPSIANPNVIFKIALQTRDWEYGDVATITVKQVWR